MFVLMSNFLEISSEAVSQVYSQVLKVNFLIILFTCFVTGFFIGHEIFTGFFTGSKFCDFWTKFSPCKIHMFFHRFLTGFSQVLIH